ncbi:STAS domain-containing protein [Sneathiella chinensis]|uniref:STAS domain-containing protein n=1 Tax=Sneathiella chinensis TaxID=349750 RepID=A0ABQ5U495_9PROT|nr:STAS domain-containing protein [Sneathiella chinensis]GLQ06964.1 hypothetical protein GCM10007924_21850 [Sneathiella chinensis]
MTSDTQVNLPPILNLGAAETLREKLLPTLALGADVIVDAATVETLTTPCLQVLLSLDKSLTEDGRTLILTNPTPAVTQAFDDLGLEEVLKKWSLQT